MEEKSRMGNEKWEGEIGNGKRRGDWFGEGGRGKGEGERSNKKGIGAIWKFARLFILHVLHA
jgi:hypothetical protein